MIVTHDTAPKLTEKSSAISGNITFIAEASITITNNDKATAEKAFHL